MRLIVHVFASIVLILASITSHFERTRSETNQPLFYGKGLLYFTENYDTRTRNDQLPIVSRTQREVVAAQMIKGADCSRYLDLTDRELNMFADLGLDYVVIGFGPAAWYNLAPTRPANPSAWDDPAYQFARLDDWIGKLQSRGIRVVLLLWGTPTWSSGAVPPQQNGGCVNNDYGGSDPYNRAPVNLNDFADFAQALATRYDGAHIQNRYNRMSVLNVTDFSLWNEPNLAAYWADRPSKFLQLNNLAYERIHAVRNDATVWGGNLLGSASQPAIPPQDPEFFYLPHNFLERMGDQLKFDVWGVHAYPYDPMENPLNATSQPWGYFLATDLNYLINAIDAVPTYAGKPVVISEFGYRSDWENRFRKIDTAYFDKYNQYHLFKDSRVWDLWNGSSGWTTRAISEIWNSTTDAIAKGVPTKNIDIAYAGGGGITLIKGDRFWFLYDGYSKWWTDTLANAYFMGTDGQAKGVPISDLDAAYFYGSLYVVIKGDRYWAIEYGKSKTWLTGTLRDGYYKGTDGESKGVPIADVDAVYDGFGGTTVIKADKYWYLPYGARTWSQQNLDSAYFSFQNANATNVPRSTSALPPPDVKASYFGGALNLINSQNTHGRVIGVTVNTLYNMWRYHSSGLVNMVEPDNNEAVTLNSKEPSYNVYKKWDLH